MRGAVLASVAIVTGVVCEAIYAGWRVRPVVREQVRQEPVGEPLTRHGFLTFYTPLALTTLLTLLVQPLVSAALGRMPGALVSLAVWPVVFGLLTVWQSMGIAYNEVVIALLEVPGAVPRLRTFTWRMSAVVMLLFLGMVASPLATLWLRHVAALSPDLVTLARTALWIGLLLPGLRVLQSWFQGTLVFSQHTTAITESVAVFLVVSGGLLFVGASISDMPGLYVALLAYIVGFALQTGWLWWRSRPVLATLQSEGVAPPDARPALVPIPASDQRRHR